MPKELKRLLDKLNAGVDKTSHKMLFFRASKEMIDILDHIREKYGANGKETLSRSEVIRVVLIHGLTDLLKSEE